MMAIHKVSSTNTVVRAGLTDTEAFEPRKRGKCHEVGCGVF